MHFSFWDYAAQIWPENIVQRAKARGVDLGTFLTLLPDSFEQYNEYLLLSYWLAFQFKNDSHSLRIIFSQLLRMRSSIEPDFQLDVEQGFTDVQFLRGSICNVLCNMCFTQRADEQAVAEAVRIRTLEEHKRIRYSLAELFFQLLFARMAFGLDEFLISSYGDPLSNSVVGYGFFEALNNEIALANLVGYSQITILTNGTGLLRPREGSLSQDEKDQLVFARIQEFVRSGLTNLTFSLHTPDPGKWQVIVNPHPNNPTTHADLLRWVRLAASLRELTVRINVAYSSEASDLGELIAWAITLGVGQMSLIEMIPGNATARALHRPMPSSSELEAFGFSRTGGMHWGLEIYSDGALSLALCHFGQQDPGFTDQTKNLMLIAGNHGSRLCSGGLWNPTLITAWNVIKPVGIS